MDLVVFVQQPRSLLQVSAVLERLLHHNRPLHLAALELPQHHNRLQASGALVLPQHHSHLQDSAALELQPRHSHLRVSVALVQLPHLNQPLDSVVLELQLLNQLPVQVSALLEQRNLRHKPVLVLVVPTHKQAQDLVDFLVLAEPQLRLNQLVLELHLAVLQIQVVVSLEAVVVVQHLVPLDNPNSSNNHHHKQIQLKNYSIQSFIVLCLGMNETVW